MVCVNVWQHKWVSWFLRNAFCADLTRSCQYILRDNDYRFSKHALPHAESTPHDQSKFCGKVQKTKINVWIIFLPAFVSISKQSDEDGNKLKLRNCVLICLKDFIYKSKVRNDILRTPHHLPPSLNVFLKLVLPPTLTFQWQTRVFNPYS